MKTNSKSRNNVVQNSLNIPTAYGDFASIAYNSKKMFESGSNNIPHNSKIETLIDKLVDTDQKFPVVNSETGELIGEIDRAIVMKSMKSAN